MSGRRVILLLLVFWSGVASADSGPVLRSELDTNVAVPGQVLVLDVTILVPTWMLAPPEFPDFEMPNVRVRLPEGASRPAMESLDGETWSGVSRSYELSPMVAGRFSIPPQIVKVTYADPDTREPIVAELEMKSVSFQGRIPAGAEGLDPFIAATSLSLEQTLEGDPEDLEPGGAFTRVVTATLSGASPIFLPPLVPALRKPGLAVYPKEPELSESSNRGVNVGKRIERVTYVAEGGGRFETPAIRLRWWNLETEEVEEAELPSLDIVSRGPSPLAPAKIPREAWLPWLLVSLGSVASALLLLRWTWPRVVKLQQTRTRKQQASESFAFDRVVRALRQQDLGAAFGAIEIWTARLPGFSSREQGNWTEPLESLGAALYGREPSPPSKEEWSKVIEALSERRKRWLADRRQHQSGARLPGLNPAGSGGAAQSGGLP